MNDFYHKVPEKWDDNQRDWCIEGDFIINKRLALINRQREAVLQQLKQVLDTLDMLDYKR